MAALRSDGMVVNRNRSHNIIEATRISPFLRSFCGHYLPFFSLSSAPSSSAGRHKRWSLARSFSHKRGGRGGGKALCPRKKETRSKFGFIIGKVCRPEKRKRGSPSDPEIQKVAKLGEIALFLSEPFNLLLLRLHGPAVERIVSPRASAELHSSNAGNDQPSPCSPYD